MTTDTEAAENARLAHIAYTGQSCDEDDDLPALAYDWDYERFPTKTIHFDAWQMTVNEVWKWFEEEQAGRTEQWEKAGAGIEERYYDSYWGWWNEADEHDCPIIVEKENGSFAVWDGWHRTAVAILARTITFPALVGRRKKVS